MQKFRRCTLQIHYVIPNTLQSSTLTRLLSQDMLMSRSRLSCKNSHVSANHEWTVLRCLIRIDNQQGMDITRSSNIP